MIFLFGPTAVGKTDVVTALPAERVEVVSADSMQVYRGMDIGTAKPDSALCARIPHHLIDVRTPDQPYDLGAFVDDANLAIASIHSRGRLPLVVGGTGYYFKHLLYGLPEAPRSDPEVRGRVSERVRLEGIAALRAQLEQVDAVSARRIRANDAYRITRAIEVYEQTGRPLSSFPMIGPERTDVSVTSFHLYRDRADLALRVEHRVARMFAAGLRDEVVRLVEQGYGPGDPGMRAIGYREFFTQAGAIRPAGEDARIAEEIAGNTRRYAKRQETFFRRLPAVTTVDTSDPGAESRLVDAINARCRELDTP